MDLTNTIAAKSDQINAEDLIGSPRTITITEVKNGNKEQPVWISVAEFPGRTYRPSKSMRRILVAAWGSEAEAYVGRKLCIFRNASIKFGGEAVGGIQISHMSHIDAPVTVALTVTRGNRSPFTVQPLPSAPDQIGHHRAALEASTTLEQLQAAWQSAASAGVTSNPQLVALKDQRKNELTTGDNS